MYRLFACLGSSSPPSRRAQKVEVPTLLTVDISLPDVEELQKLVQDGQEKGFLTYDEIVSGLEDVELTKEQIEDFYTYLIDHSIELMEGETHKHPPHEQPALAEEEKGPKLDLTVEPSLDSLRLYLREIGKVPLLTADQEVYLAKRIERGDMAAKTQMIEANLRLVVSIAKSCLGREPRPDEIAEELEMTTAEVREILRMAQHPVSLEKPIGEEEDSELGDFVEDDQIESPDEHASLSLRREDIEHALSSLPERERRVIELRFGLTGEQPCTLEEVGKAFGVTRERIRQIENNTLKKLESLPEAQGLKDCV